MRSAVTTKGCLLTRASTFLALACAATLAAAASSDSDMNRLAADSGCTLCHAARPPRAVGESVPPPAPAWSDIAKRYRGQRGAEDKLVATVMRGTGGGARHWAGEASVTTMPANPVEISEQDARTLVRWILR